MVGMTNLARKPRARSFTPQISLPIFSGAALRAGLDLGAIFTGLKR
jgi:outer membrane protein TolC